MADIFISYAREDGELVRELVRELEQLDKTVFWDRDIAVGVDFQRALETELEACSCVIVVWSKHSVQSEWVRAEAQNALTRHVLVPIQIDHEPPPIIFRHLETSQLQGFPGEHNPVSLTKLRNSVNRTLGFDSVGEAPLTEPIRDDPTLSVRLAKRVLDAMNDADRIALDTCLHIQRALSESLTALVSGMPWKDLRSELVASVAEQLNASWSIFRLNDKLLVDADPHLNQPGQIGESLQRLSATYQTDEPVLSDFHEPQAANLLQSLNCAWMLTLGLNSALTICFLGREQATVPVKLVQKELTNLMKAIGTVERSGIDQ